MANGQPTPRTPPQPGQTPPRPRIGMWIVLALVLLGINFWIGSLATEPASRVRIPYSPFFLNEVNAGHVKEITSKGTAIQGEFTEKVKVGKNDPSTEFQSEIPTFADDVGLSRLLQSKQVEVNA